MTHLENAHHSCKHPLPNGLNIFSTYFIIKMLYDIYDIENVLINCVTGKASGQQWALSSYVSGESAGIHRSSRDGRVGRPEAPLFSRANKNYSWQRNYC